VFAEVRFCGKTFAVRSFESILWFVVLNQFCGINFCIIGYKQLCTLVCFANNVMSYILVLRIYGIILKFCKDLRKIKKKFAKI